MTAPQRSGYIAIVGRPNVGKSTLLNRILGEKISITSRKPQTTRHRILGIKTVDQVQYVYVDTPGLHRQTKRALNRYMNRTVRQVLKDIDVVVFVVDASGWVELDEWVLSHLQKLEVPMIVAVNKIDRLDDRKQLLPYLHQLAAQHDFTHVIPISAKNGSQVDQLEQVIAENLPAFPHLFPPNQLTDRSDYFIVSERVREKLMRSLGDEIPYALTVTTEAFEEEDSIIRIAAVIWIEKPSQKGIVIGNKGERLKQVGQQARQELERYFSKKIYLQLWVKVKADWSDKENLLQQFGYDHK